MPDKIAVNTSEVGRALVRREILARIRREGYEVEERSARWSWGADSSVPGDTPVLLVGDLKNVISRFQARTRHEWISFLRTRKPILLSLIRTKADVRCAAAIDDLMRASDFRVWVCEFDKAGESFDRCLAQALAAGRPETLIDARYDPERRRLALQFGDGRTASATLGQLGVEAALSDEEARSATLSPMGTAIEFAMEDGGEYEIDAGAIRALLDQAFANQQARRTDAADATVGHRLRAARRRLGLTQVQLASEAGMDQAVISRLERGQNRPRIDTLRRLAGALQMSVPELLAS